MLADLARAVKAEARALGFDLVGIAGAEPFAEAVARMRTWLARGDAAGMAWLTADRIRRACRPADLLPGAQSFIAVGIGYRPAAEEHRGEDRSAAQMRGAARTAFGDGEPRRIAARVAARARPPR
jgi:epoxyqueuosine reductase